MTSLPGAYKAYIDQCMYGQTVWHEGIEKCAKKPTYFCTNSIEIKKAIEIKCDGSHEHAQLMSGLAKQCEVTTIS